MANSYDTTLVNKILLTSAISKLQGKLPILSNFTTDFSDEMRDARSRSLNVPFVSGGSAAGTASSSTDFEDGDTGTVNKVITMNHLYKTFSIDTIDFGTGSRLETLAQTNATILADKIEAAVFTLLTTANYGAAVITSCVSLLTGGNMGTLWSAVQGDNKAAVFKSNLYSGLLATDRFGFDLKNDLRPYGFNAIDHSDNGFASAGANVVGFGAAKSGIVMASAIPAYTPQVADLLESEVMEIPGLGMFVQSNIWANTKNRKTFGSFDVLFGAAVGDPAAVKLITG